MKKNIIIFLCLLSIAMLVDILLFKTNVTIIEFSKNIFLSLIITIVSVKFGDSNMKLIKKIFNKSK